MARCQPRTIISEPGPSKPQAGLSQLVIHDQLKWQGTKHFTAAASPAEQVRYSGWVEKINNRGCVQPRVMVISNLAVYNFKSRLTVQCKRRIDIINIVHLVRSQYSHQFILCCPQEYDYLYSSVQVEEICEILIDVNRVVTGNTISVEFKPEVDLSEYVLTRQEAKKMRKEHPELQKNENSNNSQNKPIATPSQMKQVVVSPAKQEKIERMSWGGDDPSTSPSSKLLPDNHVPSIQLASRQQQQQDDDALEAGNLKVFKVIDELYVVKNRTTGNTFALKPLESRSPPPPRSFFKKYKLFFLCSSYVFFQSVVLCSVYFALRYVASSCYARRP